MSAIVSQRRPAQALPLHGRSVVVAPTSRWNFERAVDCPSHGPVVHAVVPATPGSPDPYPSWFTKRVVSPHNQKLASSIKRCCSPPNKENLQQKRAPEPPVFRPPLRQFAAQSPDSSRNMLDGHKHTGKLQDKPNVEAIAQRLTCDRKLRECVDEGYDLFNKDIDGKLNAAELEGLLQHVTADLNIDQFVQQALRRYMSGVKHTGEECFVKSECKKMYADLLVLASGKFLSAEDQIEMQLKKIFNDIDSDGDGKLSCQDLRDSALVQRELRFLLDAIPHAETQDAQMSLPSFREAVLSKARGLVRIWIMREQFEAFARSAGGHAKSGNDLLISMAEVRELVKEHMPYLETGRVREALSALDRVRVGGRLTCDDFVWHFADVSHYLEYQLAQIVGLGELKRKLTALCRGAILDQARSGIARREGRHFKPAKARHMIFRGNPGTGKTTIAKVVAEIMLKIGLLKQDKFVSVQREDLVGDVIGATAKLTKKKVVEARGGVLFVDEAYRLFPKDADPKDFGREAVDELMSAMLEEDAPLMIFAGYPKLMDGFLLANPGLRSRIPTTLEFDDYAWSELAMILDQIIAKSGFRFAEDVRLSQITDVLRCVTPPGAAGAMNGRMCELIFDGAKQVLDARVSGWEDGDETDRLFALSLDDIRDGCGKLPPPADMHLAHLSHDNEDAYNGEACGGDVRAWLQQQLGKLVGIDTFKEQIKCFQEGMELDRRRMQQGRRVRMNTHSHMIFAGNPGTGKTTVARLVSELLHRAGVLETRKLVEAHRQAFIGQGVVGSAEAATLEIIESAQGGVLFIDEANQLQDGSVGQKVLETLMQRMLRPDAPVMIFAGYPEEMTRFEMANKGFASRIPYRFAFADFDAEALAKIFRFKVEKGGFELATDMDDSDVATAFQELVPSAVRSRSNGRLCETVFRFAKEQLDVACADENTVSSVITIAHVREGIRRASEWGS